MAIFNSYVKLPEGRLCSRFSRSDVDAGYCRIFFETKFPRQTATEVWRPHLSSRIFDPQCLFLEETASRHSSTWDPRLQRQSWLSYIMLFKLWAFMKERTGKNDWSFLFGGWMQQFTWGVSSWFPWCGLQCEWYEGESTGTNQFLLKLSKTSRRKRCRPTKMMKMIISSQRGAFSFIENLSKKKVHLLCE